MNRRSSPSCLIVGRPDTQRSLLDHDSINTPKIRPQPTRSRIRYTLLHSILIRSGVDTHPPRPRNYKHYLCPNQRDESPNSYFPILIGVNIFVSDNTTSTCSPPNTVDPKVQLIALMQQSLQQNVTMLAQINSHLSHNPPQTQSLAYHFKTQRPPIPKWDRTLPTTFLFLVQIETYKAEAFYASITIGHRRHQRPDSSA